MKLKIISFVLCCIHLTLVQIFASMHGDQKFQGCIVGHGDFKFRVDLNWSKADPSKYPVNNCHEMVQVKDGRLFLLTDHPKNNILIYDTKGNLLEAWTLGINGHGLTYHQEGEDEFLWLTDLKKSRVIKTDLKGHIVMELEHPHRNNVYSENWKYLPTETAIAPDGSIFVADGYGSQYIIKYDKYGKFLNKFGGKSTQPTNKGKFMQAHGIAIDHRDVNNPMLVCSARIRNEFQWFTLEGKFVKDVYLPGAYISRPVIKGDYLYSGICFGMYEDDYRMWQGRGFVTILNNNDIVVSNPGGKEPVYENGRLQLMLQDDPIIKNAHDVCVDSEGNIYVCQWAADKVYPYKLTKVP